MTDHVLRSDASVQQLVQQDYLQREFKEALTPEALFRQRFIPQEKPANAGTNIIFSAPGSMTPTPAPLAPNTDQPQFSLTYEQYEARLRTFGGQAPINLLESGLSLANTLLQTSKALVIQLAMSLNRYARDRAYNAALSGQTLSVGSQSLTGTSGTLNVVSLNGFTTARDTATSGGSAVRYAPVSNVNKLPVTIKHSGGTLSAYVVGYTPTNAGDETGPGALSLTYDSGTYTVAARSFVLAADCSNVIRVGGSTNYSVDDIGSSDTLKLASIQAAMRTFTERAVAPTAAGWYIADLPPIAKEQLFADSEFQLLFRGTQFSSIQYGRYSVAMMLNTLFFENAECPRIGNVTTGASYAYSTSDPFAGELVNGSATPIARTIFWGRDPAYEVRLDLRPFTSPVGVNGMIEDRPMEQNNGYVYTNDGAQLIWLAPTDMMQNIVRVGTKFVGDYVMRTDGAALSDSSGYASRYKRVVCVESAGS